MSLYHGLMMKLPVDRPHFEELRKAIYGVFNTDVALDNSAFGSAVNNVEFVALAAFETERALAIREMKGIALK